MFQNALPTPHKIQCIPITNSVELIVFREINVVNSEDLLKYIKIHFGGKIQRSFTTRTMDINISLPTCN